MVRPAGLQFPDQQCVQEDACNPELLVCVAPEESPDPFASLPPPPVEDVRPSGMTAFFAPTGEAAQTHTPTPEEIALTTPVDWISIKPSELQAKAFSYNDIVIRKGTEAANKQLETDLAVMQTNLAPGQVYSVAEYFQFLPEVAKEQLSLALNSNVIPADLAFTWTMHEDTPEITLFRLSDIRKDRDPREPYLVGNSKNPLTGDTNRLFGFDDTLMAGGELFAMGSMKMGPGMDFAGTVVSRTLVTGTTGVAVFLGIHASLIRAGVPEDMALYLDVPGTVGVFAAADLGSAQLAKWGLIPKRLFPGGLGWGGIVQASPFMAIGGMGAAYAFDAMGCEFGSKCNFVGTVVTTTVVSAGLSQTTSLLTQAAAPTAEFAAANPAAVAFAENFPRTTAFFSRLGAAYSSAVGVGLTPATWTIGGTKITLAVPGLGAGGFGGGVFLAGNGAAGGAGAGGAALQALGAIGAVSLGNWVGQGAVDLSLRKYKKDKDYSLVDFTWAYMNDKAAHDLWSPLRYVNMLFGALVRGIQSAVMPDTIWKAMRAQWDRWLDECNTWAKDMDDALIQFALASTTMTGDAGSPLVFSRDMFQLGISSKLYTSADRAEGCTWDDERTECRVPYDGIVTMYQLIDRFENSSQKGHLSEKALKLPHLISIGGSVSFYDGRVEKYLSSIISKAQGDGRLYSIANRMLTNLRRIWAKRVIELGLARKVGDEVVPIRKSPADLNDAQIQFLFGGRETFMAMVNGQITDESQIMSESIMLDRQLRTLEKIVDAADITKKDRPDAAAMMFGS